MTNQFEDEFSYLQADMISICLEYVSGKADEIFIHCSYEEERISCNVFYKINNILVRRSKVNDALTIEEKQVFQYDTSDNKQQQLVHIINDNIDEIAKLCIAKNLPMPTEMKICYCVKKKSMKAQYCYDLLYSNHPDIRISDIFQSWFNEIRSGPLFNPRP